jgi:hypothetical protein
MARYFALITIEDLKEKIETLFEENGYYELVDRIMPDLKVEFDIENVADDNSYARWINLPKGSKGLCGYHTLINGFTFYGISAGGDWEVPIFFIVYWDGKKLRGYIPTKGNTWNTDTKKACGNDDKADIKFKCKKFGREYNEDEDYSDFDSNNVIDFDYVLLLNDIQSRILPMPNKAIGTSSKKIKK